MSAACPALLVNTGETMAGRESHMASKLVLRQDNLAELDPAAALRGQMERQRGEVLRLILDDAPLPAVLHSIVLGIESLLPDTLCSILLVTPDGAHLTMGAGPNFPAFYNSAVDGLPIGDGEGSCGTAAATGRRIEVEDIDTHPYWAPYREVALKAGLRACWSQPIIDPSQSVVGTFAIYRRVPSCPDLAAVAVIEHASALAAIAIDRDRAQRELDRHRHDLEALVAERSATIVRLNEELRRRAEEADAANRAKSAFLANMSHEIRTPLNAVLGLAALLQDAATDPVQRQRTERIMDAGRHLLGTIDAILDLSKIDTGKFTLDDSPLRIEAIVGNVLSMIRDRAEAKGLTLRTDLPRLSFNLSGDAQRLQQALLNYLGNAVKFTGKGSVALRVRLEEETASDALLRFEVSDTGMGVPAEVLERLFNPFEQADSTIARAYGGSGLGLVITRRFAELMGGRAGAESVEGEGSTFWFTARLRKSGVAVTEHVPSDARTLRETLRRDWPGRRVLLAEDEPVNAEITRALLESVGLTVDLAVTGREAVEMALKGGHALILMDMQMPELDGIEATRLLRAHDTCARVPIIAMTANAFAEDRALCLEAGMDGFLSKPVLPGRLYAEILAQFTAASVPV
jgi:signal transduction histidine kinase/ActR/RegA family two-component response regulator